jgi:hypothetical protein
MSRPNSPASNQNNGRTIPNSPASSKLDLYDDDHYSIPDDELRSVNSSSIASDGTEDASMTNEIAFDPTSVNSYQRTGGPVESTTERKYTSDWKTITSRKNQAAAKKLKTVETTFHLDPSLSDRDLPHFRGQRMEDVQEALRQNGQDDLAISSPNITRRGQVPLTTMEDDGYTHKNVTNITFANSHTTATDEEMSTSTTSSYRRRVPKTKTAEIEDFTVGPVPTNIPITTDSRKHDQGTAKTPGRYTNISSLKKATTSIESETTAPTSPIRKVQFITTASVETGTSAPRGSSSSKVTKMGINSTSYVKASSLTPVSDTLNQTKIASSRSQVTTPVLPTEQINPEAQSTVFYTYRAQLTFGLPTSQTGVNVAKYFQRWIFSSCESIDNFSLIPFEDDKGLQISNLNQVPEENKEFYSSYYHNHRVLNQGNLTGMVAFQCSMPWAQLKSPNHPYFAWLRLNKVFLNQTKFKTSSLVPCGFLLGAHPGHLRRDEAEVELRVSLGFSTDEELPFQLSSRSVSVPIQEGKPDRYAFQAVVVETSVPQASVLREKFFSLGIPTKAVENFPYTGKYQFVPFLKTQEWTVAKILGLAKLHVKIVQDLKAIFIKNLNNIHNSINNDGSTLMQGFYGMLHIIPAVEGQNSQSVPLLHSIHNTGKSTTKVALVPSNHYEAAITQLSAIQSILASYVPPDFHDKVFIESMPAGITGQQIDSISSCNSAAFATELLNRYNPQEGENIEEVKPSKRFRPVPLTYAAVTGTDVQSETTTDNSRATISSVTSADLDNLYEKMKTYVGTTANSSLNIDELESRMAKSTKEIQEVRDQLSLSVHNITARVDTLSDDIKQHTEQMSSEINRQNIIILGMQQQFKESMLDFSTKLQDLYNRPHNQLQPITPTTTTSEQRRRGEVIK